MASIERAAYVCNICRTRKKACDKALPQCGYCTERNLVCSYSNTNLKPTDSIVIGTLSDLISCTSEDRLAGLLNLQLCSLLQRTGLSLWNLGEKYMRAFASWLPLISAESLEKVIHTSEHDVPPGDLSLLLLAMFLVSASMKTTTTPSSDLYLATKIFYQQLYTINATSRHIVHAGILLVIYEYATMRVDAAYVSLGSVARSASLIGLPSFVRNIVLSMNCEVTVALESRNLWWAIIMLDRLIILELRDRTPPPCTAFPPSDALLPSSLHSDDLTSLDGPKLLPLHVDSVSSFGRQAQAVFLLSKTLECAESAIPSYYQELKSLDIDLQSFLRVEMVREHELHSDAATIVLRALVYVHNAILEYSEMSKVAGKSDPKASSRATIDSSIRMILTAVQHHQRDIPHVDTISPLPRYALRLAIQHIQENPKIATEEVLVGVRSAQFLEESFRARWA